MSSTLLVGCGQSKKSAQVLNIYNVGDYIDEDLITKFEEETGIDVVYETYDTNEAMYQKLKSGSTKYDLIFPSDYMVDKLISEDLVSPIDYSKIPNYKYIMKDFRNPDYDPGNKYSVPYMWGTFGILYNKTMVDEKDVDSWDILWNKKYAGNIQMLDSVRDTMGISLIRLGIPRLKVPRSPCNLPSLSRRELCQQSSRLINSYPAFARPLSFMAWAVCIIIS